MFNVWTNLAKAKRLFPVGSMVDIQGVNWPVIDYSLRRNGELFVVVNWDGYSYFLSFKG